MEVGDIIQLIVFAIIFLSFFGGVFGRRKSEEERPVRPTELSESGGRDQNRPARPQRTRATVARQLDRGEDTYVESLPERAEMRDRSSRLEDVTPEDVAGREEISRNRDQRSQLERYEASVRGRASESSGSAERRSRQNLVPQRRRRIVEGGDVLRRSLKNPETLERGFIVKEVLDVPVGLRRDS